MNGGESARTSEIKVNISNLYREENFTDMRVASIRRLSPVKPDGSPDASRSPVFMGQAHIMTNAGPVPINCQIEAKTLDEAMQKFPDAMKRAVQEMIQEVREMQRQEASRIVTPGELGGAGNIKLA